MPPFGVQCYRRLHYYVILAQFANILTFLLKMKCSDLCLPITLAN